MHSGLALYILYFESFIIYLHRYSEFTLNVILRIKRHSNETYDNATNLSEIDKYVKPDLLIMFNNKNNRYIHHIKFYIFSLTDGTQLNGN